VARGASEDWPWEALWELEEGNPGADGALRNPRAPGTPFLSGGLAGCSPSALDFSLRFAKPGVLRKAVKCRLGVQILVHRDPRFLAESGLNL
jgi:hypothetical protein